MNESNLKGISVRAIIAIMLVLACIVLAIMKMPIDETIKYLAVSVVSFYFGNKPQTTTPNTPEVKT